MDDSLEIMQQETTAGCPAVGYRDVNVCVPVTIKAFGEVGNVKTHCLGESSVLTEEETACPENTSESCSFTICQRMRVEIPVIFGARAEIGDATVNCGCSEEESDFDNSDNFPSKIF